MALACHHVPQNEGWSTCLYLWGNTNFETATPYGGYLINDNTFSEFKFSLKLIALLSTLCDGSTWKGITKLRFCRHIGSN